MRPMKQGAHFTRKPDGIVWLCLVPVLKIIVLFGPPMALNPVINNKTEESIMKTTTIGLSLLCLSSWSLQAAEFCVGTATELRNALNTASTNNQDDDIRVELGVFASNGSTFQYNEIQGFDLTISGGWIDFFDNDCGIQSPNQPLDSILDGSDSTQALYIRTSGSANIEVTNLTFRNGSTNQSGGGLRILRADNVNSGEVTVANNVFISNQATFGSAMSVSSMDTAHIRNNLIIANNALVRYAVQVVQNDANGVYFNNNTVIGNTSDLLDEPGGVYLSTSGSSHLLVANNIINGNQLDDLDARNGAAASFYLFDNNVDVMTGSVPDVSSGNFNLPNRFASGIFSFTPDVDSPLVNAGRAPCGFVCPFPTPFVNDWSLGNADVLAQGRVQQGVVDIGAVESGHISDLIFWDRFD